ncbi:WxcM-like domain-containing protein [Aurantimicrobium minutum]|uniref:WxcM-like domain-containing protein n=1 Tax=Aurantimicrobium minutum TaxID=708131 RepID=UPI0024744865|nr:WxcM-like domain-containing protein [Aurantimicrobium minutum]MDH6239035.1 UDP-2-acetamido-3-amino-2,3-dideoxy-glucuronate N-acetyltransferase [Aurantimicrobium minutum]
MKSQPKGEGIYTLNDRIYVGEKVILGEEIQIGAGSVIQGDVIVENDSVIGFNVTIDAETTGLNPQTTKVSSGANLGSGAVISSGVTIGINAVVRPGSVVVRDVPPYAIVEGNPALIVGYVDHFGKKVGQQSSTNIELNHKVQPHQPIFHLQKASDMRGSLVALEFSKNIPFRPERFFIIYDVPSEDVRGEHAHYKCEQFLVCLNGSVKAVVDDGANRFEYNLNSPTVGLYMPPLTWGTQYSYSSDATLAVFASRPYESDDYIRDYSLFKKVVNDAKKAAKHSNNP